MSCGTISSVEEFITNIKSDTSFWGNNFNIAWFRGQKGNILLPKLYEYKYSPENENDMNQSFRMRAPALYHKTPEYSRIDEWLFLMRHADLPTRLLDWSEGALIALYFAINDYYKDGNQDIYVFMLNPIVFNFYINGISYLPLSWNDSSYVYDRLTKNKINNNSISVLKKRLNCSAHFCNAFYDYKYEEQYPLALKPQHVHQRITVQRGCFLIYGQDQSDLISLINTKIKPTSFNDNDYVTCFDNLKYPKDLYLKHIASKRFDELFIKSYKICNDKNILIEMMNDLARLGITQSTLFPDIDGLAKELSYINKLQTVASTNIKSDTTITLNGSS